MSNRFAALVIGAFAWAVAGSAVDAAPIFFTPSSGTTSRISYSDGQSDKGLYGNPTVVGNTFQFLTPSDFEASASNGGAETTSDRASIKVTAGPGRTLTGVNVIEFGDWSILGDAAAVKVTGALFVTRLDPGHFGVVYKLTPKVRYFDDESGTTITSPNKPVGDSSGTWRAEYLLDLPDDTLSIQIVLNNVLQATAPPVTTAFIQKKGVNITAVDNKYTVPEPASLALVAVSGVLTLRRRRAV